MGPTNRPLVFESKLPMQIIYNKKIEKVRVNEVLKKEAPQAIQFDISDCYSGATTKKLLKIKPEYAEKPLTIEVDLVRDNPRLYETKLEKFNRQVRHVIEVPLRLTDYTRADGAGVGRFVEDLHKRVVNVN